MSKKIYVGNLPFGFGYKELVEAFSPFGEVEDAIVMVNKFTNRSRGFGFVTYKNDEDADKAIAKMDKKEVGGRVINVKEAKPLQPREQEERSEKFREESQEK